MRDDQLPGYDEENYLGDKGVRLVDQIVSDKLKWIFRELRKADIGIDGQIEIVDKKKRGTGRLLAVQIKCGVSYFSELSDGGYIYRGDNKHLKYWLEHSLPVIVVVCNPQTGICYWQEVSVANTVYSGGSWKMAIPESNVFGIESEGQLQTIAGRPQSRDICELLLYRFLHEKYVRNIEICSLSELPRDYQKYAYLAKINGEIIMIDFHYDEYGSVAVEDITDILRLKESNGNVCGSKSLHICIISESKSALELAPEVIGSLSSKEDVVYFRLLYEKYPFLDLYELDKDGTVTML